MIRRLSALAVLMLVGCAQLPPRPEVPQGTAVAAGPGAPLDEIFAPHEAQHPGQSAFRLVENGTEAFAIRVQSARLAQRSLDVQTYIWHADITGMFIARQLLEAADRGVKVRVLVDDMDARAKNAGFAALAAHANIEVRLFNPFASRSGAFGMMSEGMRNFGRINHRMHNKTWIADNRVAIAGGRNIGDEYFGASDEVNFVDLDFAMIGPVVRDASASFDKYWNSTAVWPVELLDPEGVTPHALEVLRTALATPSDEPRARRYAEALRADDTVQRLVAGDWPMQWATSYRFVSDDPLKAALKDHDPQTSQVVIALGGLMTGMQTGLAVISPYFVPGKRGTNSLVSAAQTGKRVQVLTNSLVANDVAAVHGGYSRHREALLAGGVGLWELKPLPGSNRRSSLFGSSGASLHTKAFAVDGSALFVGSYNLDPRSTWLNCEQGVQVQNAELARQLVALFERQTAGDRAWKVTLADGALHWTDGQENFSKDPQASVGKRFQAWITRVLGLDAQL